MNFSRFARRLIRNYFFQRGRMGRSTLKKLLRPMLPGDQRVELEHGFVMDLDITRSNQEFIFWFYEELESSLQWAIRTLLPVGGTLVDCGANAGLMGLLAIHHRGARVIFIEPHPRLAKSIQGNLDLNRFSRHGTVCACAASDVDGSAPLYLDSRSDGGHSLVRDNAAAGASTTRVETRRLEGILNKLSLERVDFLKVDTEGHDFQALKGLGSLLQPGKIDLIHAEMWGDYDGLWNLLTERGYRPFVSDMIYIDQLRRLERARDASRFFAPAEKPGDGNLLWCGRNSRYEEFLIQTCGIRETPKPTA